MFTIIDQWDALLSDRPYREAWGIEEAACYLQENSGKIFDPWLVDLFIKMVREN